MKNGHISGKVPYLNAKCPNCSDLDIEYDCINVTGKTLKRDFYFRSLMNLALVNASSPHPARHAGNSPSRKPIFLERQSD